MPTNEEKTARYADLGRRLAAAKAKSARRKQGLLEDEPKKPAKANGKKAKPAKRKDGKTQVGPKKLTKEQKNPELTPPASSVDQNLREMLGDSTKDDKTGLTMFQLALVEKIEEKGELGVLDLCHMIWEKEEIAQAASSPVGTKPVDLTRVVRNAIRSPKNAGIIGPSGNRGKYVFLEWKKAGK